MALTKEQVAILKELIANEITSLENEITLIKDRRESILTEFVNPIAHGPGEEGPQTHDHDLVITQLQRFVTRLRVLQNTEIRLRVNRYTDKCGCGSTIGWERLKAIPETEICFLCASKRS